MPEVMQKQGFGDRLVLHRTEFDAAAIADDVARFNAAIIDRLMAAPDIWNYAMADIRKARGAGRGSFPLHAPDSAGQTIEIAGRNGPVRLRVLEPAAGPARGTYVHLHGGGWVMGTPEENEWHLRAIAEATGLRTVSVDYALAPEHPWPAAPDDCEDAVLALLAEPKAADHAWLMGGESAGAHLCAVTLLRLRDRHGLTPFRAASLVAGCFDLTLTPSVRNWGDIKLILRTRDVENFVARLLANGGDAASPAISPMRADLSGLPPALFSCGTLDLLLDDSLMMATRWLAAGNRAELKLYPGGCHVFQHFDTAQAAQGRRDIEAFLNAFAG